MLENTPPPGVILGLLVAGSSSVHLGPLWRPVARFVCRLSSPHPPSGLSASDGCFWKLCRAFWAAIYPAPFYIVHYQVLGSHHTHRKGGDRANIIIEEISNRNGLKEGKMSIKSLQLEWEVSWRTPLPPYKLCYFFGEKRYGSIYSALLSSVAEPKLFISAPALAPTFKKFRCQSRLLLQLDRCLHSLSNKM